MFSLQRSCLLVIFLFVSFTRLAFADSEALVKAMTEHLSCYPLELINLETQEPTITRQDVCLATIYHETGSKPLWVTPEGPGYNASIIFKYLKYADKEGLEPANYQVGYLEEMWRNPSPDSLAQLDTLLTYNLVKYVHDVSYGQLKPYLADPQLFPEAGYSGFDPVAAIRKLRKATDLDTYLRELPPDNFHYAGLKKGLAHYQAMLSQDEWPPIASGKLIRPGGNDSRISPIRNRLAILSGKELISENPGDYDEALREELEMFQRRHGLKADGIIGNKTLKELNITPAQRIDQIKINMARWRWLDHRLGDEYILVNIANYRLYAYREGKRKLTLPVIVGKFQHQTPVFSDRIKYLDFHPFWNVPVSIARDKELPELKKNPNYLVEKNMKLFSNWQDDGVELDSTIIDWSQVSRSQMGRYKLRQDPGPFNALGRIKFVFPNEYSVYLHDTPTKNLFDEHYRSFSHGCIRVSDPEKLALFILQGEEQGWSEEEVFDVLEKGERKVVGIRRTLPVHLTYQTAWLDKGGRIHFNGDVYARDTRLLKALLSR